MSTITLPIQATDNHGYHYPVVLIEKSSFGRPDWVLAIQDTPGRWFVSTLEQRAAHPVIAIDLGQNWMCTNLDELLAATATALMGFDRISPEECTNMENSLLEKLIS